MVVRIEGKMVPNEKSEIIYLNPESIAFATFISDDQMELVMSNGCRIRINQKQLNQCRGESEILGFIRRDWLEVKPKSDELADVIRKKFSNDLIQAIKYYMDQTGANLHEATHATKAILGKIS